MKSIAAVSTLAITGCAPTVSAMGDLARATSGMSWPGALVCSVTIGALAYVVVKVFG